MGRAAPGRHLQLWRRIVAEVGFTLVTAGVVLLAFVAYDLWGTSFAERHDQSLLARQFRAAVAAAAPRAGASGTAGGDSPTVGAGGDVTSTTGHGSYTKHAGTKHAGTKHAGTKHAGDPARSRSRTASSGGTAAQPPPVLPVPAQGVALARIFIPVIGVDRYVVQGVDEGDLQMGPGHYPGTPLPGQKGNVGIAGHRTTFGAPFFELGQLVPGDMVYLTGTSGWTWGYRVQRLFAVAPTDVAVLAPSPQAQLTLTTCTPPFEATQRLVVRAQLVDRSPPGARLLLLPKRQSARAQGQRARTVTARTVTASTVTVSKGPAPRSPATTVPGRHRPAAAIVVPVPRSGGSVVAAALWGAGAVAVWALARALAALKVGPGRPGTGRRGTGRRGTEWWRRRRWRQAGTLALGAAIACVPLWSCFANVVQLLPSNF